jgi:hypothetical protein
MGGFTIRVAQDATMPVGRCVILHDDDIVYMGKLGSAVLPYLDMIGSVIILSPADFAESMEFLKQMKHPN